MRALRTLAALLCLVLLSACVGMPTEGPVVESAGSDDVEEAPGFSFDPRPPQPGQAPAEIVSGFLEAMKETPVRTSVARQFLTDEAQETWAPETQIITYDDLGPPVGQTLVSLRIAGADVYDARGAWQRTEPEVRVSFGLTREGGEWRIGRAPDALVVPDSWFGDWYQRVSLYFFDPTAQILVPEPVFVPRGDQLASSLVRGLLTSPDDPADVARTFFPPGLTPGVGVPISTAGIAEVSLNGDPDVIDADTAQRMLTQLVWTLRQDARVRAIRLSVGGRPLGGREGTTQVNLDVGDAFDPTGSGASRDLFGLQDGRLVRGSLDSLTPTPGTFGETTLGIRSVAVNLAGTRVAGVSSDGTALLLGSVDQPDGRVTQVLSSATDLLPPAWDFTDRTWLVDRRGDGAHVLVRGKGRPREVVVPGITGRDVRKLLVSRDGSRLVALVRGVTEDRVVSARIRRDVQGRVLGATSARELAGDVVGTGRIRDVVWRSTTSVAVLSDISRSLAEVRTIAVDGAPADLASEGLSRVRARVRGLVGSPKPGSQALALTRRAVFDAITPERVLPELPGGLTYLTYVG